MDAGQPLTGESGLLNSLLKATLERGLNTELTEHLGYEAGDADASSFENSRNGYSARRSQPKSATSSCGSCATATARSPRCWSARASGAWMA